ncbi:UPF0598 protein CG30010-like [Homarus americanus]|uniref:UPF0598 protein C8orf82-like n=1 Tax=Homarus americanus TaxID=6706 RepID=A0A8J5JUP2_HOMAM|nr:UPF0598 protein CG30010-like [Homarus americanus]KAG7164400.1 UPF0598 protein C8orf82-like [Homarus americanus]
MLRKVFSKGVTRLFITSHSRSTQRWCSSLHKVDYEQGQSPETRVREYFYYVDHQGMLFMDDARIKNFTSCFKEKKFLQFFFSRLRMNDTERYPEFPFLSPCGRERNYIRCDDLPVVFTNLVMKNTSLGSEEHLAYGNAGEVMTLPFQPSELCMQVETGRVYHPASECVGGVGLVRSQLSIQLSTHFIFGNSEEKPPTHINWGGQEIKLSQNLVPVLQSLEQVRKFSLGLTEDDS